MVSLFADDMLLYRENPKDVIKKLLELKNSLFRDTELIHISIIFLLFVEWYFTV